MTPTPNRTPIEAEISSLDDFEAFAITHALTKEELSTIIEDVFRMWVMDLDQFDTPEELLTLFLEEERKRQKLSRECNCFVEAVLFLDKRRKTL